MTDQAVLAMKLRNVTKTYDGSPPVHALRDCDLDVRSGEYVAVIGPSGSGKSTFLNLVGLLDKPTAGTYQLDGHDTGLLSEAQRSALRGHRIGFVFQAFHLLPHRTVEENVMLAQVYRRTPFRRRRQEACAALDRVGLGENRYSVPTRLSGGQQQRVAIARAIVNEPAVLLCDEPTGNLDSNTALAVLDVLDQLHSAGLTILTITHDPAVASRAERVISIFDGCVSG